MIKNFNFYDIYGYFLPGLVLLTLFWLPFLLIQPEWPKAELGSAITALALAYIAGHLLQTLAATVLLSYRTTQMSFGKQRRFPSDILLDEDDRTFSSEFKTAIAQKIKVFFDIDVQANEDLVNFDRARLDTISRRRQEAFFLCRSVLVSKKLNSYGEQFEGLYTLMRGLAAAFAVAAFYYLGWALSTEFPGPFSNAPVFAGILLFLAVISSLGAAIPSETKESWRGAGQITVVSILIAAVAIGAFVALQQTKTVQVKSLLWILTLCSILAAFRSFGAFKAFTAEFAKAIYRDFYVYERTAETPKDKPSSE